MRPSISWERSKIVWGSDYHRPGLVADASYKQQLEFITVECDPWALGQISSTT